MGIAGVFEVGPLPLVPGLGRMAGGVVTSLLGVLQLEDWSLQEGRTPLCPSLSRDCGLLRESLRSLLCISNMGIITSS